MDKTSRQAAEMNQASGLCSPETELRDHTFLVIPSAVEIERLGRREIDGKAGG
jgi:hypothetical protein